MSRIAVVGLVGESVFLPVERFHTGGETVEALSFHTEPGGKGFNQAVAAARFGAEVSFLSAVGSEGYAETAKNFLEKEGIRSYLCRKEGRTAYAVIQTEPSGKNRVTVFNGPPPAASDVKLFSEEISKADILLISNEAPEEINLLAAEYARRNGVRIIMNPAPWRPVCGELKKSVFLFTPNEHETGGLDDCDNVIVTMGGRGVLIRSNGQTVPATDDVPVDTTGAGDTFNGVLAAMLGEGKSVSEAVEIAIRASGLGVTRKGAVSSIPYRAEIIKE